MKRYGIDWYSTGRTWWTKWGALRACRRVLRNAKCGAARVVIVLSPVAAREGSGEPAARPASWSGTGRYAEAGR